MFKENNYSKKNKYGTFRWYQEKLFLSYQQVKKFGKDALASMNGMKIRKNREVQIVTSYDNKKITDYTLAQVRTTDAFCKIINLEAHKTWIQCIQLAELKLKYLMQKSQLLLSENEREEIIIYKMIARTEKP